MSTEIQLIGNKHSIVKFQDKQLARYAGYFELINNQFPISEKEKYIQLFNELSNDKKCQELIDVATQAIEKIDDFFEAYIYRGISKDELKDYNGAIQDFTIAIEIDPQSDIAYCKRGDSKSNYYFKDYQGAIQDYCKAIEINPQNDKAFYGRGHTKYELDDNHEAIQDFTIAIEINPQNDLAYFGRGTSKYVLKDYEGAIQDYTISIEIDPNCSSTYYNRGLSKKFLKDFDGAIQDFTKVLDIDPDNLFARNNRSNLIFGINY